MNKENIYRFRNSKYRLNIPLFKYFSKIDYAIDCIKEKRVYLSNPSEFNDPFDSSIYNEGIGMDGKDDINNSGLLRFGKVCCFSEIKDSILMWSYYGDNHRGICLEFDLSRLDPNLPINSEIMQSIDRVQYSPIRPKGNIFEMIDSNFAITKADVWSHENEWRIVCITGEDFLPFDCVTRIILGANFDTNNNFCEELLKTAEQERVSVSKCILDTEEYRLKIIPLLIDSILAKYK